MPHTKKRADGMHVISWEHYRSTHRDFKGTWTTDFGDEGQRDMLGRRTCMAQETGFTCLVIEGRSLVIEGAPRAHRLMLDKSGAGHYVLEFLDNEGEWVGMGWGLSEAAARELLATSAKRNETGNWTITYKEGA